jgi:hypothetical protein
MRQCWAYLLLEKQAKLRAENLTCIYIHNLSPSWHFVTRQERVFTFAIAWRLSLGSTQPATQTLLPLNEKNKQMWSFNSIISYIWLALGKSEKFTYKLTFPSISWVWVAVSKVASYGLHSMCSIPRRDSDPSFVLAFWTALGPTRLLPIVSTDSRAGEGGC